MEWFQSVLGRARLRERLLTDLKRSAEEFPRFALKMVQALFPPPAVGLIAPEAVVEGRIEVILVKYLSWIFDKGLLERNYQRTTPCIRA